MIPSFIYEAIHFATKYESRLIVRRLYGNNYAHNARTQLVTPSGEDLSISTPQNSYIQQQAAILPPPASPEANILITKTELLCTYCKKRGHEQDYCLQHYYETTICKFCKRNGHTWAKCLRLRKLIRSGEVSIDNFSNPPKNNSQYNNERSNSKSHPYNNSNNRYKNENSRYNIGNNKSDDHQRTNNNYSGKPPDNRDSLPNSKNSDEQNENANSTAAQRVDIPYCNITTNGNNQSSNGHLNA